MSLSSILSNISSCKAIALLIDPTILDTDAAAYCAGDSDYCAGICPNTDLAGIGVRVAFYLQSVFNGILVLVSPDDSAEGAWSAVVLTTSLIIPAISQKRAGQLSLYHSTLVLNFSTLSTLMSLAVAPRCTIWREGKGTQKYDQGRRGRVVLAIALLGQVILQWVWATIMFTSPWHAQPYCSGSTVLFLFGMPMSTSDIDAGHFVIWPCWLLFCLGVTLLYGIILVISSSSEGHPAPSSRNTPYGTLTPSEPTPRVRSYARSPSPIPSTLPRSRPNEPQCPNGLSPYHNAWPPKPSSSPLRQRLFRLLAFITDGDRSRQHIWLGNVIAFLLFLFFVISSEMQIASNCVLTGEDTWSFGQTEAVLLAVSPLWTLAIAIYKYPGAMNLHATSAVAAAGGFIATSIAPITSVGTRRSLRHSLSQHPLLASAPFEDDQTSPPLGSINRLPSGAATPGLDPESDPYVRYRISDPGGLQSWSRNRSRRSTVDGSVSRESP